MLKPSPRQLSFAVALSYSQCERLRTLEAVAGQGSVFRDLPSAASRGLELWGCWQPADSWRVSATLVARRAVAFKLALRF